MRRCYRGGRIRVSVKSETRPPGPQDASKSCYARRRPVLEMSRFLRHARRSFLSRDRYILIPVADDKVACGFLVLQRKQACLKSIQIARLLIFKKTLFSYNNGIMFLVLC
jgi:hypothetical protein